MKAINTNYVLVKRQTEQKKEGFSTVDVQDNFVYQGVVERLPNRPIYVDNYALAGGDIVQFAKYSPDTHEVEVGGEKMKMVKAEDILRVL